MGDAMTNENPRRRGATLVYAAVMLILVMAFVAFTVDIGYIALVRGQLQNAADASSLAAAAELVVATDHGFETGSAAARANASEAARDVAQAHQAGDASSVYVDVERNVVYGQTALDPDGGWRFIAGASPPNAVQVVIERGATASSGSGGADGPLPLFFAPVIGQQNASVRVTATSALLPGVGFRIPYGSLKRVMILPFALDLDSWESLLEGNGDDSYAYDPEDGDVDSDADYVPEVNLYPDTDGTLPSGNRGTVNIGDPSNGSGDVIRQIRYGLDAGDLSHHGGKLIATDSQPLILEGTPGIRAVFEKPLDDIVGDVRAIPIFRSVSGSGSGAMFEIVRFVGVRIMHVELNGGMELRHVTVQPAAFESETVVTGDDAVIRNDSILTKARLIR